MHSIPLSPSTSPRKPRPNAVKAPTPRAAMRAYRLGGASSGRHYSPHHGYIVTDSELVCMYFGSELVFDIVSLMSPLARALAALALSLGATPSL